TDGGKNLGEFPPGIPKSFAFSTPFGLTRDQAKGIAGGALFLYLYGLVQFNSPLERGATFLKVFCSKYNPTPPNGDWGGCESAPELMIGGRVLKRTHEAQVVPGK
ncbi:MAG: hypothetical protein AAB225_19135, partial [Acidobacteriota bacterium]